MSTKSKMLIIVVAIVVLLPVGLFFRFPMARIVIPAEQVGSVFGFTITNTLLATWATMIVLIAVSYAATRKLQFVPSGIQNLVEAAIEFVLGPVESIAGKENGRRFFPLVATIFLFILVSNWMGLLPGYGTIGVVNTHEKAVQLHMVNVGGVKLGLLMPNAKEQKEQPTEGVTKSTGPEAPALEEPKETAGETYGLIEPFLRSANTDLNTTIALAIIAVLLIQYFGVTILGGRSYAQKFFNFTSPVGAFVGLLELIAEVARIISFSFRLFGNIFAGEVLLAVMAFLMPWAASLPFLGLELFVGFMQAVVFAVLTLVFSALAVAGHGGHEEEHGKQPSHAH